jgi:hypothetical protein
MVRGDDTSALAVRAPVIADVLHVGPADGTLRSSSPTIFKVPAQAI